MQVIFLSCCIFFDSARGFFLNSRSRQSHAHYGPPKLHKNPKVTYTSPVKITYDSSPAVEINEIDDGYGSPAAPIISSQPITTYEKPSQPIYKPPMKMRYHMRPPMKRVKMKMRKPSYMMLPKMPRYKLPKMRFPKFMMRMPKLPKFPRMKIPKFKPIRPMYGKPVQMYKPVMESNHGGYKHMNDLDYSGWTPIGMKFKEPEIPTYNVVEESPIVTIEDAYNTPSKPVPPLPSGDGYGAPEVITAAPAHDNSYGVPQAPVAPQPVYQEPVKTYKEPEPAPKPAPDSYGQPAAEPITHNQVTYVQPVAAVPAYQNPEPAYTAPEKDGYGEPQAPVVAYNPPAPVASPAPIYQTPAPAYTQPTLAPQTTYAQPSYGGYSSPIEEPLFEYAPVSDLNNLAAIAAEDTYNAAAAPPSPGSYQATVDANNLAEEVQSGSVYVQPQQNSISYPSYGEKVPSSQYASANPLYYQSAPYSQTNYVYPSSTYQGTGGKSSASFSIHVNGKEHGHSYEHDHKV